MHQRITVTFRGRSENERRPFVLGQTKRIMRPERADFQGRDRQLEIIDRAGRRREMKNVIDFFVWQENEIRDVVLDEVKIFVAGKVSNVGHVAGDQIIDRNDAMTFGQEPVAQMRTEKTGAAGHDRNGAGFCGGHGALCSGRLEI